MDYLFLKNGCNKERYYGIDTNDEAVYKDEGRI